MAFDPQFDPLLMAAKEATETGLRVAGIDVQMTEIGEAIQEVRCVVFKMIVFTVTIFCCAGRKLGLTISVIISLFLTHFTLFCACYR